jgi:general secretion pathway protein G
MLQKGFSYVEIIFTVAIVALMATVVVPYVDLTVTRKKEAALKHDLRQIRTAIDAYKRATEEGRIVIQADASGYPPNLDVLVNGVPDARDPQQKLIYFLRRLPADPMYQGSDVSAAETWGKRSYDSPPTLPREGKDVFDIFSKNEQAGLNGVPYSAW